jgi:hypothetical protein
LLQLRLYLSNCNLHSENKDTNFDEDPQGDDGSDDDNSETNMIIELDDHDDGTIGGDDDDDGNGNGNDNNDGNGDVDGSEIEVVEDGNLKIKQGPVALEKATQKDLFNEEESSGGDKDGESTC